MSTTVASIMVGSLTSDALYVDHFVVEVYLDDLLTELTAQDTSAVKNVAGVWTQQGVMTFTGLVLGATYYLRAGVAAPLSDNITWSATFAVEAGSTTAPAPTFIFTSTATGSGVSFEVTPSVVPANIDHYEAWWSMDGTTPTTTQQPMWSGPLNNATFFTFFVGCTSTQTPTIYIQGVNTSNINGGWIELVTLGGGTLDNIADGTSFVKGAQYTSGVVAVPNGNFEASTGLVNGAPPGWEIGFGGTGVTCSYYTADPYAGTQSLILTATVSGAGVIATQKFAVTPGDSWKLAGAVASISGQTAQIQLGWINAAGSYIGAPPVIEISGVSSGWNYLENTSVVPAGAVYGRLQCTMIGTGGGTGLFDSIQLIRLANLDDEVLDGTTYVRVGNVNADHTFHKSTTLLPIGSLLNLPVNTFLYTSTTTTVTWEWSSYDIYCPDGTVVTIGAGSFAPFTGLTANTTYLFGFYYDLNLSETVVVMSDRGGGVLPSSQQQQAQVLNGDGHVLINFDVAGITPSSGTGGGSGGVGSPPTCFTPNTTVVTRDGDRPIAQVAVGDEVLTARGTWRKVLYTSHNRYDGPLHVLREVSGWFEGVTPEHELLREAWTEAQYVYPEVKFYHGDVHNLQVESEPEDDGSQKDTEHSYTLGSGDIAHNTFWCP
jgi:hypothetical protein